MSGTDVIEKALNLEKMYRIYGFVQLFFEIDGIRRVIFKESSEVLAICTIQAVEYLLKCYNRTDLE